MSYKLLVKGGWLVAGLIFKKNDTDPNYEVKVRGTIRSQGPMLHFPDLRGLPPSQPYHPLPSLTYVNSEKSPYC